MGCRPIENCPYNYSRVPKEKDNCERTDVKKPKRGHRLAVALLAAWLGSSSCRTLPAQTQQEKQDRMPGMVYQDLNPGARASMLSTITQHETSGTSLEPDSTPRDMLMTVRGGWMLMLHSSGFLNYTAESGPRGRDRLFSTNWIMPMAQRELGPGTLTLRAMLSLEPATITRCEYPELFQFGETAYGNPIVDGQHPHNFFIELAALYDAKLGEQGLVSFYAAPVGDPALGPEAYPHRTSASEDPLPSKTGFFKKPKNNLTQDREFAKKSKQLALGDVRSMMYSDQGHLHEYSIAIPFIDLCMLSCLLYCFARGRADSGENR